MNRLTPLVGAILLVVIGGAAIWYVSAPPRGSDGYRERMGETTRTLRSQVQSARIWADTFDAGDATAAATAVGLEEAELDASAAASQFESHEPPAGELRSRTRFVSLASDTTGVLADLRIASQLKQWKRLPRIAARLEEVATRLDRFEHRVRP